MKKGHGGKKSARRWIYIYIRGDIMENELQQWGKMQELRNERKRRNEGGGSNDERMKRVKARMDQMITWSRKKWDDKEMIEWGKRK